MLDENQKKIYDKLLEIPHEEAVNAFLNFHGTALLSEEFMKHLKDEGFNMILENIVDSIGQNCMLGDAVCFSSIDNAKLCFGTIHKIRENNIDAQLYKLENNEIVKQYISKKENFLKITKEQLNMHFERKKYQAGLAKEKEHLRRMKILQEHSDYDFSNTEFKLKVLEAANNPGSFPGLGIRIRIKEGEKDKWDNFCDNNKLVLSNASEGCDELQNCYSIYRKR